MLGMISCKEASLLSAKNEEGKLTWGEKFRLRLHIMICKVCQVVQKQNEFVIDHAKSLDTKLADRLTIDEKAEIAKKVFNKESGAN